MKITRLRIAGFGPYKNEQLIDFERFDADGIFLITGKTGAGKSSILDAICFALYNSVPRFDGSEPKLRSDYCVPEDPTFVELDFSLQGQDYRVRRSPRYERAKKNGTGTTTAQPTAVLSVLNSAVRNSAPAHGDEWQAVAAKPVDVGHELSRILPLKEDQFLQVILLAQNRFQRFLLAKTEDRRTVLRTLFGTVRFEQLETALLLRRKALDENLATVQRGIAERATAAATQLRLDEVPPDPDLGWFDAALAELEQQLAQATGEAEKAADALTLATAVHQALEVLERLQGRRLAASRALAALLDQADGVQVVRAELAAAARAGRVWPQIRSRQRAADALEAAGVDETDARVRWQAVRPTAAGDVAGIVQADQLAVSPAETPTTAPAETPATLTIVIDDVLGRLGSLSDALADERELPGLDREITQLEALLARHTTAQEREQARIEVLPDQIETARADHAAATLESAHQDASTAALVRAEAALVAAEAVLSGEKELVVAITAESTASRANTAAAVAHEELLARRFAGYASELASLLIDGEACSVCGSASHPRPTRGDGEPVTEKLVTAARKSITTHQRELDDAHAVVQGISTSLAEARIGSGNRAVTELASIRDAARDALDASRAAAERLPGLDGDLARLRAELADAALELTGHRAEREAAATRLTERTSHRDTRAARVREQRGGFDSVADQVARLQAELTVARALDGALARCRELGTALDGALAAVTSQLRDEGFDTEEAAITARLSEAETTRRESGVRSHDDGRAAARAILDDPELAELPVDPVDRGPARRALADAGTVRDSALGAASSVAERAAQLAVLVTEARAQFAVSAALMAVQGQVRGLAAVVHGEDPNTKRMRLETYVLAAQLEEIVAAANIRLRSMTSGRYTLEHDDSAEYRGTQSGLGLAIRDEYTGRNRATHSLSGGETFLASLALALGLAEVVTSQSGGVTLDTLFVDEGFGSLDGETLETAMSTLDTLRAGGRTIGLISHVDSMKEQIPAKLSIRVTDAGHSEIASH